MITGKEITIPSLSGSILLGLFAVSMTLFAAITVSNFMSIILLVMAFAFGKFLIYDPVTKLYAMSRVGLSKMSLYSRHVAVGETITIDYTHTFKTETELTDWTITLSFVETATYKQGTKTKTVRHVVEKDSVSIIEYGQSFYKDQTITEQITLTVPHDAMHSLDVYRNKLHWFISYNIYAVGLKPVIGQEVITVLPQVVADKEYK